MFKHRSYQKELLDETIIAKELLFQNLKELEIINTYLGGHRVSLKGLRKIINDKPLPTHHLMDIGCGGGDSIKVIQQWAVKNKYRIKITGIDLKQDCIDYAHNNCKNIAGVTFRCDDFRTAFFEAEKITIVHASLFCHHFTETEIISFMELCNKNKAIFVINDLERNPLAYYSIKLLTVLFSKSRLVKNDAPLSVRRGFKKTEWKAMLQQSGIKKYSIQNYWAFRHLIIVYPNE